MKFANSGKVETLSETGLRSDNADAAPEEAIVTGDQILALIGLSPLKAERTLAERPALMRGGGPEISVVH